MDPTAEKYDWNGYDTPTEKRLLDEVARLRSAAAVALTQFDGLAAAWGNPAAFAAVRDKLRAALGEGK